jgi:hypothetical protein
VERAGSPGSSDLPRGHRSRTPWVIVVAVLLVAVGAWGWREHGKAHGPVGSRSRVVPITTRPRNVAPGVAYVGDASCASCHAEIAEAYSHHPMGRSMSPAARIMPDVSGTVLEVGDLAYSIDRRDGRLFHRETRRDAAGRTVETTKAEVLYVLGSGERGLSFLVGRNGLLYQSPLAWYTQRRGWDLAPGYHDGNLHFDRPITLECLFCHSNRVEMAGGGAPVFQGLTIGCERCHGPGELHARDPHPIDGGVLNIVNPADLEPPSLREAVCDQCHLQGPARSNLPGRSPFDFRPGLPPDSFLRAPASSPDPFSRLAALGQVEQMHQSRCYQQTGGRLGCISCHDPHRRPEPAERIAYYRNRCLECHSDHGCSLPQTDRRTRSPEDDCTACHMPRAGVTDVAHTALTRHAIPRLPERSGATPPSGRHGE